MMPGCELTIYPWPEDWLTIFYFKWVHLLSAANKLIGAGTDCGEHKSQSEWQNTMAPEGLLLKR